MTPFYGWGSTPSRVQNHYEKTLFLPLSTQEIPGTHFIDMWNMRNQSVVVL